MINEAFPSAGTVTITIEAYDKLQDKLHTALAENKRLRNLNVFRCKKNSHNDNLSLELAEEAIPFIDKAFSPFKGNYECLDVSRGYTVEYTFAKPIANQEPDEPANT